MTPDPVGIHTSAPTDLAAQQMVNDFRVNAYKTQIRDHATRKQLVQTLFKLRDDIHVMHRVIPYWKAKARATFTAVQAFRSYNDNVPPSGLAQVTRVSSISWTHEWKALKREARHARKQLRRFRRELQEAEAKVHYIRQLLAGVNTRSIPRPACIRIAGRLHARAKAAVSHPSSK